MSILGLILAIALVGFIVWLITNFIPMPAPFKQVIIVIAVVLLILWILAETGALAGTGLTRPIHF